MNIQLPIESVDSLVDIVLGKRTDVSYRRDVIESPPKISYIMNFTNLNAAPWKIQLHPIGGCTEITFPVHVQPSHVLPSPLSGGGKMEIFNGAQPIDYNDPIDKAKYGVCHSVYLELALHESMKDASFTQKVWNGIPSMEDVDTSVGESLSFLRKPDYKVEREQLGKNIHYTVHKNGAFVGVYRIKPGEPGGSIQFTDDPKLSVEWSFIFQELIWGDLQRKFGKFPWKPQIIKTDPVILHPLDSSPMKRPEHTPELSRPDGYEIQADKTAGTAIYKRDDFGNIGEVKKITTNPGWVFEIGQKTITSKPENVTLSREKIEPIVTKVDLPKSQDVRIAKRREKVRNLSEKGEPIENIARNVGTSTATVVRDRKSLGIATPRAKHKP